MRPTHCGYGKREGGGDGKRSERRMLQVVALRLCVVTDL